MGKDRNSALRVVVADDDFTTRTIMADYLMDEGYHVDSFASPEEIGALIGTCDILIMDVRFGRDRLFAGIDYVSDKVEEGTLQPQSTAIVFVSRWGRDRQGVPERLARIARFEWLDVSTGMELTELKRTIQKAMTPNE